MIPIRFKLLSPAASLPEYKTAWAAGGDLRSDEDLELAPSAWAAVGCGFAMEIPQGYEAQVRPRSGLALKHGVTVLNAPGTIDADYRGEVKVILINHGKEVFSIHKGDRIAQMVISGIKDEMNLDLIEVEDLQESDRGAGGFGSTGRI